MKAYFRGEYGHAPGVINPEVQNYVLKGAQPITCRPADLLEPELDKLRAEVAPWMEQEEDLLSYAQFDQVAVKFFEERNNKKYKVDAKHADAGKSVHPV